MITVPSASDRLAGVGLEDVSAPSREGPVRGSYTAARPNLANVRRGPVRFRSANTVRNFAAAAFCSNADIFGGCSIALGDHGKLYVRFGELDHG